MKIRYAVYGATVLVSGFVIVASWDLIRVIPISGRSGTMIEKGFERLAIGAAILIALMCVSLVVREHSFQSSNACERRISFIVIGFSAAAIACRYLISIGWNYGPR
jgi:hypothetical protein